MRVPLAMGHLRRCREFTRVFKEMVQISICDESDILYIRWFAYSWFVVAAPVSGSGFAKPTALLLQQYPMALEAISYGFRETRRDTIARRTAHRDGNVRAVRRRELLLQQRQDSAFQDRDLCHRNALGGRRGRVLDGEEEWCRCLGHGFVILVHG